VIQTRYGRVVDRIRAFNQEHNELRTNKASSTRDEGSDKRFSELKTEMGMLVKRGNYLKLSLFALLSSILGFVLTSFIIFFTYVLNIPQTYPIAILTLSAGLIMLVAGVAFAVKEIAVSYAAVVYEVESEHY
jgi:Na+/melibiose symporter-like transporter